MIEEAITNTQPSCKAVSPNGWSCEKPTGHTGPCMKYGYGELVIEAWENGRTLTREEFLKLNKT